MSVSETLALLELTNPATSLWRGIIAFATVIFGLGFVAYFPVIEIIGVATMDRRIDNKRIQGRQLRKLRRIDQDLLTALNGIRSTQLDLLELRDQAVRVLSRYEGADAKTRAAIDAATEGSEERWRKGLESALATRARADQQAARIKALQAQTEKVRNNLTDFDVDKFEAGVRKMLRSLA